MGPVGLIMKIKNVIRDKLWPNMVRKKKSKRERKEKEKEREMKERNR